MATHVPFPSSNEFIMDAIGYAGGSYSSSTSAQTGTWACLEAVGDTVFTSVTGNVSGLSSFTLKDGRRLYGQFTGYTISSGALLRYNDPAVQP